MTETENTARDPRTLTLALTGASGMPYALRLLERLLSSGQRVYLLVSGPARQVLEQESSLRLPARASEIAAILRDHLGVTPGELRVFGKEEWGAPVASGSGAPDAMVVCPCTMGTLASIATGVSRNLIERAADVVLKERRTLILVPRETPYSSIHLENMLRLSHMGAIMLPPNPGFYHHPRTLEDLVDFVVARILDHLGITHDLVPAWGLDHV